MTVSHGSYTPTAPTATHTRSGPPGLSSRLRDGERLAVTEFQHADDASLAVAHEIARLIRERSAVHQKCVLGLATGSTPLGVYRELVRLHQMESLSFQDVVTFNLDEYYPISPEASPFRRPE